MWVIGAKAEVIVDNERMLMEQTKKGLLLAANIDNMVRYIMRLDETLAKRVRMTNENRISTFTDDACVRAL